MNSRNLVLAAVAEHAKTFNENPRNRSDKRFLLEVSKGGFTADLVAEAAAEYKVARQLPKEVKSLRSFVATTVNELVDDRWSEGDLSFKANICNRAAEEIFEKGATGRPVSLVSKLAWFLSPTDWTRFDSQAADALGICSGGPTVRAQAYYCSLDQRGFDELSHLLNQEMQPHGLYGTRVIDKALWILGLTDANQRKAIKDNLTWLEESADRGLMSSAQNIVDSHQKVFLEFLHS